MIEQEREVERELIKFKRLRLITPELANKLGINAEGPIFVSPRIGTEETCGQCGTSFKPLVYQQGSITRAHHFHEDSGGIYYNEVSNSKVPFMGWRAFVEPFGKISQVRSFIDHRSEAIKVTQIQARCIHHGVIIDEGLVVEQPSFIDFPPINGNLYPICGDDSSEYFRTRFRFKFEDGSLLFSQV